MCVLNDYLIFGADLDVLPNDRQSIPSGRYFHLQAKRLVSPKPALVLLEIEFKDFSTKMSEISYPLSRGSIAITRCVEESLVFSV